MCIPAAASPRVARLACALRRVVSSQPEAAPAVSHRLADELGLEEEADVNISMPGKCFRLKADGFSCLIFFPASGCGSNEPLNTSCVDAISVSF